MKSRTFSVFCLALCLAVTPHLRAQSPRERADACPNPAKPCHAPQKQFAPWELSFRLPAKLRDNTPYFSTPFYAIILKTKAIGDETDCDGGEYTRSLERERLSVQRLFPTRKVFAEQQCPDMAAVGYEVDGKMAPRIMLCVYAGRTKDESNRVLSQARKRYPKATLHRMRVIFERIMQ